MESHAATSPLLAVRYRGAWMQKHPSPSHHGSDFHWHPADVPARIRVELASLLARHRSERASLWILAEDHVVWARSFSATAPGDRRVYTGLAAIVAVPEEGPWQSAILDILAHMPLPPAAPCTSLREAADMDRLAHVRSIEDPAPVAPSAVAPERLRALFDPTQIAQAVYLGGPALCTDPLDPELPAVFGHLLTWLPPAERAHPRQGLFLDQPTHVEVSASKNRGMVNLLHYLTLAWFCPDAIRGHQPGFAVQAWQLVLELAAHLGRTLPDLLAELGDVAAAWDTTEDLRSYLLTQRVLSYEQVAACDRRAPRPLFSDSVPDAGWLWNRIMNYWGRALLPASDAELERLVALLARRIAVDHLFHLDAPDRTALPRRYLRRLLYESLLPHERCQAMTGALARYLPSLFQHPEVPFG